MSTITITINAPTWSYYVIGALLVLDVGLKVWIAHLSLNIRREQLRWRKV